MSHAPHTSAPPPTPYGPAPSASEASASSEPSPSGSSSSAPMTAPGAPITVPQEQLDRYAALVLSVMQLRNYVALNRARLPAALLERWDAWYRGLGEVLQRTQTDQLALRQVLSQLPSYERELSRYRAAFAEVGGGQPPPLVTRASPAGSEGGGGLRLALVGGAGVALGWLIAGLSRSGGGS